MPDEPKELPDAVKSAIATLKAHTDTESVIAELKGSGLYQAVYNAGHSDATTRGKAKEETQSARLKEANDRAKEAEDALAELKKTQPDLDKRDKAWQVKLDEKQKELDTALGTVTSIRGESIADKTHAALAGKLRPKYAKLLAPTIAQAITRKADGTYELIEDGIPVQIPKGKTVWDVAAERAVADADPEDVLTNADTGGGTTNGRGNAGFTDAQLTEKKRQEANLQGFAL